MRRLAFAVFGIVLSCVQVGCPHRLARISSGEIGCDPAKIQITNDDSGYASRSWTASCEGRLYYCSSSDSSTLPGTVSCTSDKGSNEDAPDFRKVDATPAVLATDPPDGAAGFILGEDLEATQSRCTEGGGEWIEESEWSSCSVAPESTGFATKPALVFSRNKLKEISIEADDEASLSSFLRLREQLEEIYGPGKRGAKIDKCNVIELVSCIEDGRVKLKHSWRWRERSVHLELVRTENGKRLRITYRLGKERAL